MKVFAGLLALVVVASAVTTESYRQGRQYEYQYKAHSLSAIPLISNDRTGLSLWTKVQLYFETDERIVLQLEETEVREVSLENLEKHLPVSRIPELHEVRDSEEYKELPADIKEEVLEYLNKPIRFTLERSNGLVRDIMANEEEPEWALNMKKAILNKFQVQRINEAEKREEDTIIGEECEVMYDLIKDEKNENLRYVTKSWTLEHCETPSSFRDVIGIQGHRDNEEDDIIRSAFVSTSEVTDVNNRYFINYVVSEGRITLRPFSPEAGEIVTYSRQELNFTEEVSKTIRVPTDLVKRSDSLFSHMQTEDNEFSDVYTDIYSETEKVELIKKLLVESVEKMESETEPEFTVETTQEMIHAIKLMRSLRIKNSFIQLVEYFWQQPREEQMRPMFVSCLSFCGSPALVEALPELEKKFTTYELNTIITALPSTQVPTKETLVTLKNLYTTIEEESTCRQLLLVLGTQVHDLCKPIREGQFVSESRCDENTRTLAKKFFISEYQKTTEETRKLIVLKAIGNSGLDLTDFLKTQIEYTTLPEELRVNAIYALRRVDDYEQLRETLIPVFRNEKNEYPVELRISAFDILMERIPTEEMLNTLVAPMNLEENRQVGNYVYSYLNQLIELPTFYEPTKNLTIAAQNLLSTLERFEDGIWYSKNVQYLIASMSRRFAQFIELNMVNTESQSLPRSANFKLAKYISGFYTEMLETGFRFEGLDNLFEEYITYLQPESDLIKILTGDRFKREVVYMKSILKETIKDKETEETRGYFFLKHLGNEIGVFTTKDYSISQIKEQLESWTSLEANMKYFNILPITQATIKVQSLIGMPVVVDWNMISVLSLRSEVTERKEETLVSREFSPRFLIQSFARAGIDMGLFKTTTGHRMHVTFTTPFELRVERSEDKLEIESWINTEKLSKRLSGEDKEELFLIEAMPVIMTEIMTVKDTEYKCEVRELEMPTLKTPFEYEIEYEGLRVFVESHEMDFTQKLPVFPFCGRHIIRVEFVEEPKPMGFQVELEYTKDNEQKEYNEEYKYTTLFTINPKIEELKEELNFVWTYKTEEEKRPIISVEIEPKWQSEVYRMFVSFELLEGEMNPAWSWMESTEEKPIEYTIRAQWGEDKEYNPETEDLVVKSVLKKSDLQKHFEVEDEELEGSDCYKCEQEKEEYMNIYCDRCIYKRSWLSQIESKVFLTKEKMEDFEYLMPLFVYYSYPYYSIFESDMYLEQDMHAHLIKTEKPLLAKHMRHIVNADDVITYQVVHDVHPYFTEQNVTVVYDNKMMVFLDIPLIPAFRRMYNLPLYRWTDVATDRFNLPSYGKCTIDELNNVQTLDTVVYELPKEDVNCEQVLVKDITKERELEITSEVLTDEKRSLKVQFGEHVVEIKPVSDSYEVRVNNQVQQWEDNTIRTGEVRVERVEVETPKNQQVEKIVLYLEGKYIKCELLDELVSVEMPFWYKAQLTGLCGDYNGEEKEEYKLPSLHVAPTLKHHIKAYSGPSCRIHRSA